MVQCWGPTWEKDNTWSRPPCVTIVVFEVDPINANTQSGSQKTKASILGKKFNKG